MPSIGSLPSSQYRSRRQTSSSPFLGSFQTLLEVVQCFQPRPLKLSDPPVVYVLKRYRIQEVQLLAPAPARCDQVRALEHVEMLGYRLPCHLQVLAQLRECPRVMCIERIK